MSPGGTVSTNSYSAVKLLNSFSISTKFHAAFLLKESCLIFIPLILMKIKSADIQLYTMPYFSKQSASEVDQ